MQLGAGGDAELREHPIQVRANRPMTEVEARPDLAIREAVGGETGDLEFLWGELIQHIDAAVSGRLAAGSELLLSAVREVSDADRVEKVPG